MTAQRTTGNFWGFSCLFSTSAVSSVTIGRNRKSAVSARAFVIHDRMFIRVYRSTLLIMGHTCISLLTILLFCLDHFRIRFLVLTLISVLVPMLLATPDRMSRSDGTKVTIPQHPSRKTKIIGLFVTLMIDSTIVLLFPMFFASNWFYTWHQYPPPFSGSI